MYVNAFSGSALFQFAAHINLRFGRGASAELPGEIAAMKPRHVFVVSDPGVRKAGLAEPLMQGLTQKGIAFEVFSDVESNPRDSTIPTWTPRSVAYGHSSSPKSWSSPCS
jgi:alcohol dehydrogenase class IV